MRKHKVPNSVASAVKSVSTHTTRLIGTDRLLRVEDVSQVASGSPLGEFIVTPGSFPRLARMASAFQRIRWRKLKFHIQPHVTTSSSGGYVAGFVADPTDDIPTGTEGLDMLTAQACSTTANIYEPSQLVVPARDLSGLKYTSESRSPRFYSPGKFVLMADGKATQAGSLVVTCEWEVTLEVPGLEDPSEERPGLYFHMDTRLGDSKTTATAGLVYDYQGTSNDASTFSNVEEACPNKEDVYHFILPYQVTAGTTSGDSTSSGYVFWNLHYIKAYYDGHWMLLPSEYRNKQYINHVLDNHVAFLPRGAECNPTAAEDPAVTPGEDFREVTSCHSVSGARIFSRPLPSLWKSKTVSFIKK